MIKREKVYSPSLRKYFLASLAEEYKSNFSVELQTFITEILIPFKDNKNLYSMFYDFSYIAGFHSEEGYYSVHVLLTDDASVYDNISFQHALCWIHEGRHFKKLNPLVPEFRDILESLAQSLREKTEFFFLIVL